jgi:hypothetical protein
MNKIDTLKKLKEYVLTTGTVDCSYVAEVSGENCYCALGYIAKVQGAPDSLFDGIKDSHYNECSVMGLDDEDDNARELYEYITKTGIPTDALIELQEVNDHSSEVELISLIDRLIAEEGAR